MPKTDLNQLTWFQIVAEERSFTKAAAKLGVAQSTLSHTIKQLEERMGLRLLTRTTRNVATTAAGERLLQTVTPRIAEIEEEIAALSTGRGTAPACSRRAAGDSVDPLRIGASVSDVRSSEVKAFRPTNVPIPRCSSERPELQKESAASPSHARFGNAIAKK